MTSSDAPTNVDDSIRENIVQAYREAGVPRVAVLPPEAIEDALKIIRPFAAAVQANGGNTRVLDVLVRLMEEAVKPDALIDIGSILQAAGGDLAGEPAAEPAFDESVKP